MTSNFLQYNQEAINKRECQSFIQPSKKDQSNLLDDYQEFKAPKDLDIEINNFTSDQKKDLSFIQNQQETNVNCSNKVYDSNLNCQKERLKVTEIESQSEIQNAHVTG